jgi:general stress protein CsbA
MSHWRVRDWVALILALALAITLIAGFTIAELQHEQIPEVEINFFSVLAGGMVAEIATYIALTAKEKRKHEEDDDE